MRTYLSCSAETFRVTKWFSGTLDTFDSFDSFNGVLVNHVIFIYVNSCGTIIFSFIPRLQFVKYTIVLFPYIVVY